MLFRIYIELIYRTEEEEATFYKTEEEEVQTPFNQTQFWAHSSGLHIFTHRQQRQGMEEDRDSV